MTTDISPSSRRTITTVVAIIVILAALIGLFFAGFQWLVLAVVKTEAVAGSPPREFLVKAALLGTLPKIALLVAGIFLLFRNRWAVRYTLLAALLAIVDAWYQIRIMLPPQLIKLRGESQELAYLTGIYAYNFLVLVFFTALLAFLYGKGTRQELARRVLTDSNQSSPP